MPFCHIFDPPICRLWPVSTITPSFCHLCHTRSQTTLNLFVSTRLTKILIFLLIFTLFRLSYNRQCRYGNAFYTISSISTRWQFMVLGDLVSQTISNLVLLNAFFSFHKIFCHLWWVRVNVDGVSPIKMTGEIRNKTRTTSFVDLAAVVSGRRGFLIMARSTIIYTGEQKFVVV